MVTFHVIGHRGLLGSAVLRRWQDHGSRHTPVAFAQYIVNCVYPDDWRLLTMLPLAKVIQPSTDAIAEDSEYAVTKRAVEQAVTEGGGVVLRTGLVDIRRQPETAFDNWHVNPLTPLEWADLAWELKDRPGIHPDGRETLTRYQVACDIAAVYGLPAPLRATDEQPLSRLQPASRRWPLLPDALRAYRDW